jgi:hypothetical protein
MLVLPAKVISGQIGRKATSGVFAKLVIGVCSKCKFALFARIF